MALCPVSAELKVTLQVMTTMEQRSKSSRAAGQECPVITHETRWAMRLLRRVFGLCRAYVCDTGLKGRFPIAQGEALGEEYPQNWL
jgi:hypothetical protein